ncbi:MAG: hypothetical protein KBT58_08960 [Bizionia sp.]|nr:hypothetical protein [Bizionia sp.]
MFSQKKNKQFKYKSRFSESEKRNDSLSEEAMKSDISSEWEKTRRSVRKNKLSTLPMLLIILALIIGIMYYLDIKLR